MNLHVVAFVLPAAEFAQLDPAPEVTVVTVRLFTFVAKVLFAPRRPTCGWSVVLFSSPDTAAYTQETAPVSVFRRIWKLITSSLPVMLFRSRFCHCTTTSLPTVCHRTSVLDPVLASSRSVPKAETAPL